MASGNTVATFTPLQNEPPTTNYATLNTRNSHPILDFDGTTQEAAIFTAVMPRHYSGLGVTVYVHWIAAAISGSVGWDLAFERIGAAQQDIDSDGWGNATTVTAATVDGASGNVTITNAAITNGANMDSVAVGESFRLRIRRDVANDTAVGDASLVAVEIKET